MSKKNSPARRNAVVIRPHEHGTIGNGAMVRRIEAGQVSGADAIAAMMPVQPPIHPPEVLALAREVGRMRKELASFSIRIDTDPISAMEQKCELLRQCKQIADTIGFHLLRSMVEVLYEKFCPEGDGEE